ncbi:MAG: FAD binding domain-containing protein, partial [Gemmatimonadaceae bacterium]
MSTPFRYERALTIDDAARRLSAPEAAPLGGGTDLLVAIAEEIERPTTLVDLRGVAGSDGVSELGGGDVRIGASTRIAAIAANPMVRERYPALADACDLVGTPALREMGTLGGNLCQRPRCWYFRRAIPCYKNGGDSCPAAVGENQY